MHPLQSPQWEQFRAKTHPVSRINSLLVVWSKIPHTPWYFGYCPKSRIPTESDLNSLREEAVRIKAIGIRLEPDEILSTKYLVLSTLNKGRPFFTDKTFYLDLTKSQEELLTAMHPKARYNIRLAKRHGVQVVQDNSDDAFNDYLRLTEETTRRHRFFAHDKTYHQNMWGVMKEKIAHLFLAKYKGETLAAWIIFKYGDKLYYPYGASGDTHKEVMAPSLLLWETALWGKRHGCKIYDLWVADENKGFTKFKEQFGPQLVQFIGTYDLVVNPVLYGLFRLSEEIRWKILQLKT